MTKKEDDLISLVDQINLRNHQDWDTVGAITGDEGVGKTDLMILIGLLTNGFEFVDVYSPTKEDLVNIESFFRNNMLYTQNADEIDKIIENATQYAFIGVDEGMMILYKYEHGSKRQIELKKYFATCRKGHNNAIFFCMQDFLDFTKFFRDRRIRTWIHVVERGKAIVMKRSGNPVTSDKWNMDKFSDLYNEYEASKDDFCALGQIFRSKKYLNYKGSIYWNKLPSSVRNLYDKVRAEVKEQYKIDDEEPEEKESIRDKLWRERFLFLVKYVITTYGITQTKVAEVMGVAQDALSRWLAGEKEPK